MPDSTSSTILPTYDVSHQKTEPLLKTKYFEQQEKKLRYVSTMSYIRTT